MVLEELLARIPSGTDAVFLPGKLHGCECEIYIIYLNECANDGKGSWEIEIVDRDRIMKLHAEVGGDAEKFFDLLPDMFHGEWHYCDNGTADFVKFANAYHSADFILGRDGNLHDEMMFLLNWAKKEN